MTNNEVVLYLGGEEYLFVNVEKFEIDGEPSDPTSYSPEFQLVPMGGAPAVDGWDSASWVTIDGEDKVRFLAKNDILPLSSGHYWVFIKLTSQTETVIRQAGGLHVRTSA